MAEILIFPKQTVVLDQYSDLGFYTALIDPAPITFTVGESYRVIWNDTEWYCVAQDAGAILEGTVFVGDASLMGLSGNGEPFVIGGTAESPMNIISLNDSEPSTHSVAIYKVTDEEPEQDGIVLKDRKGNDVAYYGIETVTFDTTTEGKQQTFTKGVAVEGLEIVPDFSGGDMAVNAPVGMLVKSAVVKKPDGLAAENIRKGTDVAGVTGDFIGDTETAEVALDMADGDQEITPSVECKVLTRVTVKKPETLVPENIAKDVEIGGVVGTHQGGAGLELYEPEWIDDICFWDYDGTLVMHIPVEQAANLSELPTPPAHDGLTFQGWNYTLEQVQSYTYPIDVGAIYTTDDGTTRIRINITNASYLAVCVSFKQTVAKSVTIDWGDGKTSTSTSTINSALALYHTYASVGEYWIAITVASGTITLGSGIVNGQLVASGSSSNADIYRRYVTDVHVGENAELAKYTFEYMHNLTRLTIPHGIATIPGSCFDRCGAKVIALPSSVSTVESVGCSWAGGMYNNPEDFRAVLSIPESVSTVGSSAFSYSYGWRLCIPKTITTFPSSMISGWRFAKRLFISDDVTDIGQSALQYWTALEKVTLPTALTTFAYMNYLSSLKTITIPPNLATIGSNAFQYAYALEELRIPATVTSVSSGFLGNSGCKRLIVEGALDLSNLQTSSMHSLREIIYLSKTPPSKVNLGSGYHVVYVPDAAYDAYVAAASSTSYVNMIKKHSEYPGELPM